MVSTLPPTVFAARQQDVIFHVENARRAIGALEELSDADEVPALAVRHGRVGDALEKMRARLIMRLKKLVRARLRSSFFARIALCT